MLSQVTKLSRTLQSEKIDLTVIPSLVEATLHLIDSALNSTSEWVLTFQNIEDDLDEALSMKITMEDIESFKENVGKPFVCTLIANISSQFTSQDVASAFSIFDPRKLPHPDSSHSKNYGEELLMVSTKSLC